MVMALHKLTAGDGYLYLTRDIATPEISPGIGPEMRSGIGPGDELVDYYTAEGNPPGRWLGRGLDDVGLQVGDRVSVAQMKALFGEGMHPDAERIISDFQREHITADMSPDQLGEVIAAATQAARLGSPFLSYRLLAPFEDRVAERLALLAADAGREPTPAEVARAQTLESRRQRHAVAGYDLVFTPPKTVSLLWALHPDPDIRHVVKDAHDTAITSTMRLLEQHAAFTRTGKAGVAQIEATGLLAVAFDHCDSRDGDPNLHTHVAISNKVRGVDGVWRALDARPLHAITVAASEHYNATITHQLTETFGLEFEARQTTRRDSGTSHQTGQVGHDGGGKEPVWEVVGMRPEWAAGFSRRSAAIGPRYEELVDTYRAEHGRDPSARVAHQLARQANLETRQAKTPARSLAGKREDWITQFVERHGHQALRKLARITNPANRTDASAEQERPALGVDELAETVVSRVSQQRSTWTIWNLRAEAERLLHDPQVARRSLARTGAASRAELVDLVSERAAGPGFSISLAVPALAQEPARLRRSNGESVFVPHGSTRYTSQAVLNAEQRLLDAAREPNPHAPRFHPAAVAAVLDAFDAHQPAGAHLDPGQRALVVAFATDPRRLVAGLGAAGTGKTTAMRAYLHVLTNAPTQTNGPDGPDGAGGQGGQRGPRMVPLATSAVSAAVLGDDLCLPPDFPAENLHKFLYEHTAGARAPDLNAGTPPAQLPAWVRKFALQPGDVVLVDEAGMAGTHNLDRLVSIAQRHGASVRLLGDPRQLAAVESGGALRLIAEDVGAVELSTLHRFADAGEAEATLKLRVGDTSSLDFYASQGRIKGGSGSAMRESSYTAWATDMRAGLTSFMPAATNHDVIALSARARADRVTAGQVDAAGIALHDGNLAGVGDWIVTRRNNRRLPTDAGGRTREPGRGHPQHRAAHWVRNGDGWEVTKRHEDGGLDVVHLRHGGHLTLPAAYVREHVELLYATTVHRVQGGTVDTAHPLITDAMTREHLYVAATRARSSTTFHVATHDVLPLDKDARMDAASSDPDNHAAREVLHRIVSSEGAEKSATQTVRDTQDDATSLATLIPRYLHADAKTHATRLERVLDDVLGPRVTTELVTAPDWPDLTRALRRAEHYGWDATDILTQAVRRTPSPLEAATIDGSTGQPASRGKTSAASRLATAVDASVSRRFAEPDAATPAAHRRHTGQFANQLGHAVGSKLAERIMRESAWPAVQSALRDANRAGLDIPQLLRASANRRKLNAAPSASQTLASRLHQVVHHEMHRQVGSLHPVATADVFHDRTGISPVTVGRDRLPPWLPPPGSDPYLQALADAIQIRTEDLAQTFGAATGPWASVLGSPPADNDAADRWRQAVGFVAAYREQHRIDDDTHALGPYLPAGESGPDRAEQQRGAQHHAAVALIRAHHLGHHDDRHDGELSNEADQALQVESIDRRIALDTYLGLPAAEQTAVAARLAVRITAPAGTTTSNMEPTFIANAHANADLLSRALGERGHLAVTDSDRAQLGPGSRDKQATRTAHSPTRGLLAARPTPSRPALAIRNRPPAKPVDGAAMQPGADSGQQQLRPVPAASPAPQPVSSTTEQPQPLALRRPEPPGPQPGQPRLSLDPPARFLRSADRHF